MNRINVYMKYNNKNEVKIDIVGMAVDLIGAAKSEGMSYSDFELIMNSLWGTVNIDSTNFKKKSD